MSLVGDIIMELRQRIPDAPQVAVAPNLQPLTATTGGVFTPGTTVYVVATQNTQWGETTVSSEQSIALGSAQTAIQATVFAAAGITTVNLYYGLQPGQEQAKESFPLSANGTYLITGTDNITAIPPTRNTAFLPDTDGNFIGSYAAYRLLKRAADAMVKIAGGIVDVTGVRSTVNSSMYRLDSPFYTFVNSWYDGYPMDIVPRSFMFLRNSAAGFSGILSYEQDGPQSVIQVWPQSNRSGGSTQLAFDMDEEQDIVPLVDGSGFLSIGLCRVDDEVMGFSSASPYPVTEPQPVSLRGVIRGLGGTSITSHFAGAPVEELNIRMSGYRTPKTYKVGDALETIMVPQAWEEPLVYHMLAQVRSMEQDDQTATSLMANFVQMAEKIAKGSRLGHLKPRQIPIWGQQTTDARNVNGIGFGWLVN